MSPIWKMLFPLFVLAVGTIGAPAEGKAQEGPKDIIATQIRSQGYACDSPQSAERDTANETVWMLRCQNASYRVTLIPNLAAKVEKVGD